MIRIPTTTLFILIPTFIVFLLIGCENQDKPIKMEGISTIEGAKTNSHKKNMVSEKNIDLSKYFDGMTGCAIFYVPGQSYYFYNKELATTRLSPFSTFKIMATLIGLNNNVLKDESTYMDYNGTKYWLELWNKNVNLKEAFQVSCVWYFHKVINKINHDIVTNELKVLNYGNSDTSAWYGNNSNKIKELNGFWLNSSLKISPLEQVQILENIFEKENIYDKNHINILKNIMKSEHNFVFGKTGSGPKGNGWYVGFIETENDAIYFAILLNDSNGSGVAAKKITLEIIKNFDPLFTN